LYKNTKSVDFLFCIFHRIIKLYSNFEKCKKWNVINPHIELEVLEMTKEKESHKFYTKWEESLQKPDPNYNVNLKMEENKIFRMNG